jgi:hypothetical protein
MVQLAIIVLGFVMEEKEFLNLPRYRKVDSEAKRRVSPIVFLDRLIEGVLCVEYKNIHAIKKRFVFHSTMKIGFRKFYIRAVADGTVPHVDTIRKRPTGMVQLSPANTRPE